MDNAQAHTKGVPGRPIQYGGRFVAEQVETTKHRLNLHAYLGGYATEEYVSAHIEDRGLLAMLNQMSLFMVTEGSLVVRLCQNKSQSSCFTWNISPHVVLALSGVFGIMNLGIDISPRLLENAIYKPTQVAFFYFCVVVML